MALAYCTDAQLDGYMSAYGVISFADHDQDGTSDANVVDDCKTYGFGYLTSRLVQRYTAAILATVPMIAEVAAIIVLRELCLRRGNAPPASLEMRYQEITQQGGLLDQIVMGKLLLVDLNGLPVRMANGNTPAHANLLVDRRFAERRVRVVTGSSNMDPTKLRRDSDLFWEYDR